MLNKANIAAFGSAALIGIWFAYRLGQRSVSQQRDEQYEMMPNDDDSTASHTLQPIGELSSVYLNCVGTPRQGTLDYSKIYFSVTVIYQV